MSSVLNRLPSLRAELGREPPRGAKERVLVALLAQGVPRRRPSRALVLVLVTLVATTAAAVGANVAPRWAARWHALNNGASRQPSVARHAPGARPVARGTPTAPATGTASALPATPVPGPDLPAIPPVAPPIAQPAARPSSAHVSATEGLASLPSAVAAESELAQQVAAYREASSLVATSPGLAVVRLRAFEQRWPASPLGEEVSVRLVQALGALGRDDAARAQARAFVQRFPHSPRRGEMEALAAGARLKQVNE